MEPPVTPKPMPASLPGLPTNHANKLFGMVYITLTGVVDAIVPTAGPWSWVGKSASYLLKLAPLLWWALPAKNLAQVTPGNGGPAARDWIPDNSSYRTTRPWNTAVSYLMRLVPVNYWDFKEIASPVIIGSSNPEPNHNKWGNNFLNFGHTVPRHCKTDPTQCKNAKRV
ncbi:hypothetical protein DSO57_1023657 [Entomophthora muscae]|uniref:Uncharacterized protein n=1 Tax=Entomophthora muscae TaxID=34485 RepID=A0ACC2S5B7_9FUNG|nr:hypothetical protein DSO57_1023657 [Entomophthora muscae]